MVAVLAVLSTQPDYQKPQLLLLFLVVLWMVLSLQYSSLSEVSLIVNFRLCGFFSLQSESLSPGRSLITKWTFRKQLSNHICNDIEFNAYG